MKSKKLQSALSKLNETNSNSRFDEITPSEALQVIGGVSFAPLADCNAWAGTCGTWGGNCGTWGGKETSK